MHLPGQWPNRFALGEQIGAAERLGREEGLGHLQRATVGDTLRMHLFIDVASAELLAEGAAVRLLSGRVHALRRIWT